MKKLYNKIKTNRGSSSTIEMIFIVVLLFSIMITLVDFGVYFLNRNIITNSAHSGARIVAVYGGSGGTPVERKYGTARKHCMWSHSSVGCQLAENIMSQGLVSTNIRFVECGPDKTAKLGETVYCEVTWDYNGIPGSPLGFAGHFDNQVTRMTAESEVIFR